MQVVDVVRQVVGVAVDQTQTVVSGEVVRWIDTTTAAALAAHEADTTGVHGIADTSALVVDTDARLTDARTPTAHKSSHATGGSDALSPSDIDAVAINWPTVWTYPMVVGNYYSLGSSTVTGSMSEGVEMAQEFIPARSCTLDRVGIVITTTAGSSGAMIRLGLRAYDLSTGMPGALVADFGTVDATSTGAKTITISQAVTGKTVYFLTATCQGSAATKPTVQTGDKEGYRSLPYSSPSAAVYFWGKGSQSGALNDTGSFTVQWALNPRIWVRASA